MATTLAWVALGALLGGPARYFISSAITKATRETFPFGTLTVNLVGAFLIGLAAAAVMAHPQWKDVPWAFAITGFLGTLTTVSAFSLQTLMLAREGQLRLALANVALTLTFGLICAALGFGAGTSLFHAGAA